MIPQLATPGHLKDIPAYCDDPAWSLSQKLDGDRRMVHATGGAMVGYNKTGGQCALAPRRQAPAILKALVPLLPGPWLLDGELLDDGNLWFFDLLETPKGPCDTVPLETRLLMLANLGDLMSWDERSPVRTLPTAVTRVEKLHLAMNALSSNVEGLVAKRLDSIYDFGYRPDTWMKLKHVNTVDCVVIGLGRDGKENIMLGLYDETGLLVDIGDVTARAGDGAKIRKDDVISVRYVGWSGNKLIQPTLPKLRLDKPADQCTLDQLVHLSKQVVTLS